MAAIYRYFDKLEYATSAALGDIVFTRTTIYRELTQSTRWDELEQIYTTTENGVTTTREIRNDVYSLSCSHVLSEHLKRKFGQFVIRITDPKALLSQLSIGLSKTNIRTMKGITSKSVTYFDSNSPDITDFESRLFAKGKLHSDEEEYRFLFIPAIKLKQDRVSIATELRFDIIS